LDNINKILMGSKNLCNY